MACCAVLFSQYVPFSTVSEKIWIPSSVSTPQVGFVSSKASPTLAERFKFQIRRRSVEVPCSGVPFGSLARFGMAVGSLGSTLGSENRKELKRFPSLAINVCDKA